jgi:antitoxin VapB
VQLSILIHVYILWWMAERAKLFKNGGSQAVRLPKDCRFPDDQSEVVVRKVGNQVVLEPVDAWPAEFLACLGAWEGEIPRPKDPPVRKMRDPFA